MNPAPAKNKLYNIHYLRGFAAFMVMGLHTRDWINNDNDSFKAGDVLFNRGGYGVEIFFISGFIMVYTTQKFSFENKFKGAFNFMMKRLIRIFPLYFLLSTISVFVWYDYTFFLQWTKFAKYLKSIFFIPYDSTPILEPGWSLNLEIFFYLLFSISILFGKTRYHLLLSFFAIMIVVQQFTFHNSFLKMISSHYNNYFLFGVLLGLIINRLRANEIKLEIRLVNALYILCFAVLIILFFASLPKMEAIEYPLAILAVGGIVLKDISHTARFSNFLFTSGNISYSYYLLHVIVNKIFMILFLDMSEKLEFRIIVYLTVFIATFYLSKVSYKFIEIKFSNFLTKYLIK